MINNYFDWVYYKNKYSDINQHCKTEADCVWHFFGNFKDSTIYGDGMREGRLFNKKLEELENYTIDKYINENKELNNKTNYELHLHFLDNYEKLKTEKLKAVNNHFDIQFYKKYYTDLKNLSDVQLKEHFINHGINESRIFNEKLKEFNKKSYLEKNKELSNKTNYELHLHFLDNYEKLKEEKLKAEKLKDITTHFDIKFYREYNSDLKNLSDVQLKEHFINHGINESRLFNEKLKEFNKKSYLEKNKELSNKTNYELCVHFLDNYENIIKNYNNKFNINNKLNLLNKLQYRNICENNIDLIKKIIILYDNKNDHNIFKNDKETVLIEFRILNHLEYLIRNMLIKLPNWKHTIVCGNINYNFINKIIKDIPININIIKLNIDDCSQNIYNNLLLTKEFWNRFEGKKLLLYQEDSFIFHAKTLDNYLKYDYVGAPWLLEQNDNLLGVGNGGFSLRSKELMLNVLGKIDINKFIPNTSTLEYIKSVNLSKCPEDVYFSKSIIDNKLGNIPNREISKEFSQERVKSLNPIGGHNFFMFYTNLDFRYKNLILINDNYYKHVNHRGGWNTIIKNLIDNNIIINKTNDYNSNILFIDNVEKYFLWDNNYKLNNEWCGIIHMTNKCPTYLNEFLKIDNLLNCKNLIESMKYCNSLIIFNKYLKEKIVLKFNNIKVKFLLHPNNNKYNIQFNIEKFSVYNKYNIILLGQQLRRISDIYKIRSNLINEKYWLSGIKNEKDIKNLIDKDSLYNNIKNVDKNNLITNKYFEDFNKYDEFLVNNIIVIPLYDSSSNNSILEIIFLNCPAFITKLDSTIEYLGKDYPMFFDDINEINNILSSKEKLLDIYKKTNKYLINLDKSKFDIKLFNSELLKCINYID